MSKRKSIAAASAVGLALAGAGVAYAASLTLNSTSLAGGQTVVAACQTTGSITPSYTSADANGLGYKVTAVVLTGVDLTGCAGKTISVTISDGTSSKLASGTLAVPASGSVSVTVSPSILVSDVKNLSIQIA